MAMVVSLCVVTHHAEPAGNWKKLRFFSLELFCSMKFVCSFFSQRLFAWWVGSPSPGIMDHASAAEELRLASASGAGAF